MASAISTRIRKVRNNVAAVYASTLVACMTTMNAFAANTPTFNSDGTFNNMRDKIGGIIASAVDMLRAFVVPLATVACLCAILIMYLPGMSTKTTDRCKTVIWSCIATVVIAFALSAILTLAGNIGGNLTF